MAPERGGMYVGKILKGAKPADLPMQQSTKVETGDQYQNSESAQSHYLHRMKIEEQDRELLAAAELPLLLLDAWWADSRFRK